MTHVILNVLLVLTSCTTHTTNEHMPDMVYCPVLGEMVSAATHRSFGGEKVYFCCDGCADEFESNPSNYATNVNAQLAGLGRFQQSRCPLTGRAPSSDCEVSVAGVNVQLADEESLRRFQEATADEQVALVFSRAPFQRGFHVVAQPIPALAAAVTDVTMPSGTNRVPVFRNWWWLLIGLLLLPAILWNAKRQQNRKPQRRNSF